MLWGRRGGQQSEERPSSGLVNWPSPLPPPRVPEGSQLVRRSPACTAGGLRSRVRFAPHTLSLSPLPRYFLLKSREQLSSAPVRRKSKTAAPRGSGASRTAAAAAAAAAAVAATAAARTGPAISTHPRLHSLRAACSLQAVRQCAPPPLLSLLGLVPRRSWQEREACEEACMASCVQQQLPACERHARDFCAEAFSGLVAGGQADNPA